MFRKMRRSRQELSYDEGVEILKSRTSGVLALLGDDGYPYAVPLSYVFANGKLYFHSATEGHKLDAIKNEPKASFCVIAQDDVLPEKYTTCYKSVIVFGKIRVLDNQNEKRRTIGLLAKKYSPNEAEESRDKEIERFWQSFCMLELDCEHISAKEAIELTKQREK